MRLYATGVFGDGFFNYTLETEKLIGRGCVVLKQEHTGSKPNTACKVAIKAIPVAPMYYASDLLVEKCDCVISVPITLNRAWSSDVDLYLTTYADGIYNPSGETIRAAVSGEDYHSISGVLTLTAGSTSGNFDVTLINNTGDNVKTYFSVIINSVEYGTICETDFDISNTVYRKVVIQPTGI